MTNQITTKLISKKFVTDTVLDLHFETSDYFEFTPGQFFNIAVTEPFRRPYSIVDYKNDVIRLMIDVRLPGKGSDYFKNISIGTETKMYGPIGKFTLLDLSETKIFLATGVGIAPFIPMIKSLDLASLNVSLFFGLRDMRNDKLVSDFLDRELPFLNYVRCYTGSNPMEKNFKSGRIYDVIENELLDFKDSEFYICGGNQMVRDTKDKLIKLGANNIFIENYG